MTFYWPHAFWLLIIPLALAVRDLRRRAATNTLHPKITLAEATQSSLIVRPHASTQSHATRTRWFLYLGLTTACIALARPQWGKVEEPVFDQAREILVALDLSRSMLSQDVKPSRLERGRLLITSLLERLKGERVGLVVFSGTAFLQSPLSSDYEILREFLPLLNPDYLPEGGTNYDALLATTLSAFGSSSAADRFLIILSDGEALTDTWKKHLDELKTKGIRILCLGIGTTDGAMIPDGNGAFVKDERGAVVMSKLNSATLRELAEKTDGTYADASSWVDLSQLIQTTVDQGRRGEFKETSKVRLAERYQWPLAATLAFLLLSFWREVPVHPKPRALQLATKVAVLALLFTYLPLGPLHAAAEKQPTSPAPATPVTELISRLATSDQLTAQDYAELARTTLAFGEQSAAANQPVSEGAVRDALAGVKSGAQLDPKAADWPTLREQLESLLPPKDPPPCDKSKPEDKKPDQNQDAQKSDPSNSKDQQNESSPDQNQQNPSDDKGSGDNKDQSSPNSPSSPSDQPPKNQSNGQSAFGDMSQPPQDKSSANPDAQPQPSEAEQPDHAEMQQVGGVAADTSNDPAAQDPNLAVPLQVLDQVKQSDSPARLFQILQGPNSNPDAPKGKDW